MLGAAAVRLEFFRSRPNIMLVAISRFKSVSVTKMYKETTREITVTVQSFFLGDESSPDEDYYVWAYQVRIENNGGETVRLRNRYWRITDANGRVQEVRGPGVVGEHPVLKRGESFEYTSGCPLPTPSGIMVGAYEMESAAGEPFEVAIPAFSLDSPHDSHRQN